MVKQIFCGGKCRCWFKEIELFGSDHLADNSSTFSWQINSKHFWLVGVRTKPNQSVVCHVCFFAVRELIRYE